MTFAPRQQAPAAKRRLLFALLSLAAVTDDPPAAQLQETFLDESGELVSISHVNTGRQSIIDAS